MNLRCLNFSMYRFILAGLCLLSLNVSAQTSGTLVIRPGQTRQTVVGFGASLAYYESWLNAHPKKAEIYQAIFGELSLDILRVRNAYDYDSLMVGRVKEYMAAAEASLGYPISLFSTSWGPPGYLKNTGDRKNGGSLRYSTESGSVEFDYAGFAHWWNKSLDEYETNGIMPDYISIQNEPNWSATWETCLFNPRETINSSDTIAGYNKALDAVYDTLASRTDRPMFLGPETVGIGYNNVENYINALDLSKLDGISHLLYHGVDENNPYASTDFSKVGDFHPELPHFQTEYSRGDWFSLAGLIYKSFYDEQVVAYLYWDLIWNEGGLVQLDHPWDQSQWTDPLKGYTKTKDFYAFKQFSAFIHPGWRMIDHSLSTSDGVALTFLSPTGDSASCVLINKSSENTLSVRVGVPDFRIHESAVYITSESKNCELEGPLADSLLILEPHSITTVDMRLSAFDPAEDTLAPSIPSGVFIEGSSSNSLTLSWSPSIDSFGVAGYRIYVDGVLAGSIGDTLFVISGLQPNVTYEIEIAAFDKAGNESGKSDALFGIILFRDTIAPILQATKQLYQEGNIVLVCSEAGVVYLVPEQTPGDLLSIREFVLDSMVVGARKGMDMFISGYENGNYWLYAVDSAENISEPEELTVLGLGIDSEEFRGFGVFPNPFDRQTILSFTLDSDLEIWLSLIDSQGRILRKESCGYLDAGQNQLVLQRDNLPAGMYFFRLESSSGEAKSGQLLIRD
jgi:glucuronoarabinoxylan endo-1,4-beta-xylanase